MTEQHNSIRYDHRIMQSVRWNPLTVVGAILLLAATATAWNTATKLSHQRGILQSRLDEWSSIQDIARSLTRLRSSLSDVDRLTEPAEYLSQLFRDAGMAQAVKIETGDVEHISANGPRAVLITCRFSAVSPDRLLPLLLEMEKRTSALRIRECRLTATESTPPNVSGVVILQALTN